MIVNTNKYKIYQYKNIMGDGSEIFIYDIKTGRIHSHIHHEKYLCPDVLIKYVDKMVTLSRSDNCICYTEDFCEARDCSECSFRE